MTPLDRAAVLVSIKPPFVAAIAAGLKTIELRRRFPEVVGMPMVIHATQPVGAIVGVARIDRVERASLETLWAQHRCAVGVEKAVFDSYFAGCTVGYAVHLSDYQPIVVDTSAMRTIIPGFRPPQSYRYLGRMGLQNLLSAAAEAGA